MIKKINLNKKFLLNKKKFPNFNKKIMNNRKNLIFSLYKK